jgi:dTMP kinase
MSQPKGLFIVIEGSDGSGKGTQFNLLKERLRATGYDVAVFDFPRYENDSSYFIRRYLNGEYGPASKISPYTASLFFALDRFEASKDIEKALREGKVVLSNRYVGSNMAHQGGKFADPVEQRGFFVWEDNLEFELLKIPRPDINFFLRVPAQVSYELIKKKSQREYTAKSHDEHEGDLNHLKNAITTYDLLCQLFPKDFTAIECTKAGKLLSIAEISNLIWDKLKPLLPVERPNPSQSIVVDLNQTQDNKSPEVQNQLDELRFSFRSSSLLLKLQIEREKPGSTGNFTSWRQSNYAFYKPANLSRELAETYRGTLQNLASLYEASRIRLQKYLEKSKDAQRSTVNQLLLPLTPLAALVPFDVTLKKDDIESLCTSLLIHNTAEAQWAANQLYLAAKQKWPADFKQLSVANSYPESINQLLTKLADERLSHGESIA